MTKNLTTEEFKELVFEYDESQGAMTTLSLVESYVTAL